MSNALAPITYNDRAAADNAVAAVLADSTTVASATDDALGSLNIALGHQLRMNREGYSILRNADDYATALTFIVDEQDTRTEAIFTAMLADAA